MAESPKTNNKTFCLSEYDVLKRVILCQPQYMTIREVINETQENGNGCSLRGGKRFKTMAGG